MTKASTPRCAPVAAAIAVLLLLGRPVAAVTYIVDQRHPQASDQNAGTAEAPFKTIGRALFTQREFWEILGGGD